MYAKGTLKIYECFANGSHRRYDYGVVASKYIMTNLVILLTTVT